MLRLSAAIRPEPLPLNRMTVTDIAVFRDFERGRSSIVEDVKAKDMQNCYSHLIYAAALCNDASFDPDNEGEIIGDSTEGALIHMSKNLGIDHEILEDKYPRVFERPFDSDRKLNDNCSCDR